MKRKWAWAALFIVTGLALVTLWVWPGEVSYAVEEWAVQRSTLTDSIKLTGVVTWQQMCAAAPETAGRIEQIYVSEGQQVEKGQALYKMDAYLEELKLQEILNGQSMLEESGEEGLYRLLSGMRTAQEEIIARTTVRAQIDGVVQGIKSGEGDLAAAGQQVMNIHSQEQRVIAQASGREAGRVRPGQSIRLIRDGERIAEGQVCRVSPEPEGGVSVEVELTSRRAALTVGELLEVEIVVARSVNALVLPLDALTGSGQEVYLSQSDRAQLCEVQLGMRTSEGCEILSGISEGERVVMNPPDEIKHGSLIRRKQP